MCQQGCFYHGCSLCPAGKKLLEKEEKFHLQAKRLLQLFPDEIVEIIIEKECKFEQRKEKDLALQTFLKQLKPVPLKHLSLRNVNHGSLSEAYCLQWEENDKETFHALDCASLFPFVTKAFQFPYGQYRTLRGDDLDQTLISYEGEDMYYNGEKCFGAALTFSVPPKNCLFPYLYTEVAKRGKIAVICRQCANTTVERPRICKHPDEKRGWWDVYSTSDIGFTTSLQYRHTIAELLLFERGENFFEVFVNLLSFDKIRFSPAEHLSEEQKQEHCRIINSKMNFKNTIGKELKSGDLESNPECRETQKQSLNCFLGQIGVNTECSNRTRFITRRSELIEEMANKNVIEPILFSMQNPEDDIVMVQLKNKKARQSRKTNVMISQFIISLGKKYIYKIMMQLVEKKHATIYKVCVM